MGLSRQRQLLLRWGWARTTKSAGPRGLRCSREEGRHARWHGSCSSEPCNTTVAWYHTSLHFVLLITQSRTPVQSCGCSPI